MHFVEALLSPLSEPMRLYLLNPIWILIVVLMSSGEDSLECYAKRRCR